nr:MAG TPA: hypothetical protein [Bacteriophage sp.]
MSIIYHCALYVKTLFSFYISIAIFLCLIHIVQKYCLFVPYIYIILRLVLCLIYAIIKLSKENKAKRKRGKTI